MSNEHNEEALRLIKEINKLNTDLAYAISRQDMVVQEYNNLFWFDEEATLRKRIIELERAINLLD